MYPGEVITREINEKIYGALHKLMDYEDTEVSPNEVAGLIEFEGSNTEKYLKELAKKKEYEKLEKQGLLLRLPCKVGDKIFAKHRAFEGVIVEGVCIGYEWWRSDGFCVKYHANIPEYGITDVAFSEFGKTVFLTREEAGQALAKMKEGGGENGNKSSTIHL